MKSEIILVGGGGHCKSVIDVIELENKYKIAGIIDKKEFINQELLGYKIIGYDDDLKELHKKYKYAIVTIGQIKSNKLRINLFNILKDIGYKLPVIKSPLAYISKYASIDEGTVVHHHVFINADVKIGKNCIINSKALVEHDAIIKNHSHISTAAVINGGVLVKENTFIGSNATTKESIIIDGFIKAGELKK
jgi:sugar O-acyltransferase (sialic acid O-acetyltransferase NeuD family)